METKLERIELSYQLRFTTPFHCGTGLRLGLIDRTIVRDHDGYLYVPGSTIKGILREQCERLARLYETVDDEMRAAIASPHNEKRALWGLGRPPTMVTRIFGSHNAPGHLFFEDARQTSDAKREYDSKEHSEEARGRYKDAQVDLYTQVQIDRLSRTAAPRSLYTSEFGLRDFVLEGAISGWLECFPIEDVEGKPTYSLLLLLAGLRLLDRLGGNKSTGKGQCQCEEITVRRDGSSEMWQHWLDRLDALSSYSFQALVQEEDA